MDFFSSVFDNNEGGNEDGGEQFDFLQGNDKAKSGNASPSFGNFKMNLNDFQQDNNDNNTRVCIPFSEGTQQSLANDNNTQGSTAFMNNLFAKQGNEKGQGNFNVNQEQQINLQKFANNDNLIEELKSVESLFSLGINQSSMIIKTSEKHLPQSQQSMEQEQQNKNIFQQQQMEQQLQQKQQQIPIQPQPQLQPQLQQKRQQYQQKQKQLFSTSTIILERQIEEEEIKKPTSNNTSKRKHLETIPSEDLQLEPKPIKQIRNSTGSIPQPKEFKSDIKPQSLQKTKPKNISKRIHLPPLNCNDSSSNLDKSSNDNSEKSPEPKMTGNPLKDHTMINDIYLSKKEELNVFKIFPELHDLIFNATQDFNHHLPELLEHYLENYHECLTQMTMLLDIDNNEIDEMINLCEQKLSNFNTRINNL